MSESNFNVIAIRMHEVEFSMENEDFLGDINLETLIESKFSLAADGENQAKLQMEIKLFPTLEDVPFRIKLIMEGIFAWEDKIDEKELELYLKVNGNAVLYSYARPIISQLTTFAGFPSLILPLNNFVEDCDM